MGRRPRRLALAAGLEVAWAALALEVLEAGGAEGLVVLGGGPEARSMQAIRGPDLKEVSEAERALWMQQVVSCFPFDPGCSLC